MGLLLGWWVGNYFLNCIFWESLKSFKYHSIHIESKLLDNQNPALRCGLKCFSVLSSSNCRGQHLSKVWQSVVGGSLTRLGIKDSASTPGRGLHSPKSLAGTSGMEMAWHILVWPSIAWCLCKGRRIGFHFSLAPTRTSPTKAMLIGGILWHLKLWLRAFLEQMV